MSLPPETELSNQMPWVEGATRVFGVIAHPVDHVRAPMVFNPRFAAAGCPISWCQSMRRPKNWNRSLTRFAPCQILAGLP